MVFDVEDAGGLVGSFQKPTSVVKIPGFPHHQGSVGYTLEEMGTALDPFEERKRRCCQNAVDIPALIVEVLLIEGFPHLAGDLVANASAIFSGPSHAGCDRALILLVEGEEVKDGSLVLGFVPLRERFFLT